jgi:hypothetical protein
MSVKIVGEIHICRAKVVEENEKHTVCSNTYAVGHVVLRHGN